MSNHPPPIQLASLLLHLGRAARPGDGDAAGLTAAQWAALRYFAQANAPSRTPSAFASFHATSRGTASQTIRALVARRLLARSRTGADARWVRIDVTPAGAAALAGDPIRRLTDAVAALPDTWRATLAEATTQLVCAVDTARGQNPFGFCPDCAHCAADEACDAWCARHAMALAPHDLTRLCADFAPRSAGPAP
jgi:DNA-binding MarR family transcriptional regulator